MKIRKVQISDKNKKDKKKKDKNKTYLKKIKYTFLNALKKAK